MADHFSSCHAIETLIITSDNTSRLINDGRSQSAMVVTRSPITKLRRQ